MSKHAFSTATVISRTTGKPHHSHHNWRTRIAAAFGGGLLAATSLGLPATHAAQLVTLSLGAAERSIEVSDLVTFANTDDIPRGLQWYVDRFEPDQVDEFRSLLSTEFEIDPLSTSRFLNGPLGSILLERLLVLFRTNDPDTTLKALRSAIVLAAFDREEGFSIINVIQKWPLREVELNFNVALDAIEDAEQLFVETEKVSAYLRQEAIIETANTDLPANLPNLRDPGIFTWTIESVQLVNAERIGRNLISADIYMPEGLDEEAPLVVISHGLGSSRTTFGYLAEHLASHGIAVAAIEHPATNSVSVEQFFAGFLTPAGTDIFLQRPRDITLLLDELEAMTAPGARWEGQMNTSNVGVVGQSLGGYTALAIGGADLDINHLRQECETTLQSLPFNLSIELQCQLLDAEEPLNDRYSLRDDRVAAVMAINPVSSAIFGPAGMGELEIPITIVASRNDFFAPAIPEQVFPYIWTGSTEGKYLVYVENATHFSFLGNGESGASASLLPSEMLGPEPEGAQPVLQALGTAFMQRYLDETDLDRTSAVADIYSNAYLGRIEHPSFRFFLSNSLSMDDINLAIAAPLSQEGADPLPIPFF
ncbi:MAG: alpha/beta hydrolase [Cyanobacteria bacterium P01_A01_bin.3]